MVNHDTTWLITGGCGFIGKRLVQTIRKKHPEAGIRVLDNLSVGTQEDLHKHDSITKLDAPSVGPKSGTTELVVSDIRDRIAVDAATTGCEIVVHLAANTGVAPSVEDPRSDCETNVIGTLNALEASKKHACKRFVFASSGAPVGECIPPIHEEMPCHPVSPYGASKLAGEGYCSAYYRTYGLETVCLRFGNVYGPGSNKKSSVIAKFIKDAAVGKSLEIYGDGTQTRDFIFLDDLVQAILQAAHVPNIGGEIFQIATSKESSLLDLLEELKPLLTAACHPPTIIQGKARKGDVKQNFSDTRKASSMLGWNAKTKLITGLEHTIQDLIG